MGSLDVSGVEKETLRDMWLEAFELRGTPSVLYEVDEENDDLNKDPNYSYKEPQKISLMFDSQPKKIIQKNGWQIEGDVPDVVYILTKDANGKRVTVNKGAKVEIPYVTAEDGVRTLFVGKVTMDSTLGLFYIATLSPNRVAMVTTPKKEPIGQMNPTGNNLFRRKGECD